MFQNKFCKFYVRMHMILKAFFSALVICNVFIINWRKNCTWQKSESINPFLKKTIISKLSDIAISLWRKCGLLTTNISSRLWKIYNISFEDFRRDLIWCSHHFDTKSFFTKVRNIHAIMFIFSQIIITFCLPVIIQ